MADFEAPSGPPPPKVPEGWVARWNEQYHEWFYVNTYTKKSQWDKPTAPAVDPNSEAPAGPPPGYTPGSTPAPSDAKANPFVNTSTKPGGPSESEDERLARQLQEEENARAQQTGSRGAASSYMSGGSPAPQGPSAYPDQLPPRPDERGGDKSRGLLGKIFGGGNKNKHSQYPGQGGYPQGSGGGYGGPPPQQYGGYGSPGPQQYGGYGPPPGQYGGYGGPPGGYGGGGYGAPGYGAPPGGFGGGYGGGYGQPQQGYYQQGRPQKAGGGGMGAMGGAALGLGAGVLGGALIADAIDDREDEAYAEGYNDGQDGGDFDGGDF